MKHVGQNLARVAAGFLISFAASTGAMAADFPQGLMLHFNFDGVETGSVSDRAGRNNNGRVFGAKWLPAGKQASACEFAATNSYIRVPNSPSLNPTQATFAVWFKISKPGISGSVILDKEPGNGYAMLIAGDAMDDGERNKGKLCAFVNGRPCYGDSVVADGLWHHGAATFDGERLKLYVDGQLQKQPLAWQGEIAANTNDLMIGMTGPRPKQGEKDVSFNGAIDELMIFNHALSDAEVKTVMESVKSKFTKDQVARRLAELKELFDRGLLTKDFYDRKVKECEVTP